MKEKPHWFSTEPKDPKKKVMWNKKGWNWCGTATGGKCEAFVRHQLSKYKGIKKRKIEGSNNKNAKLRMETAEVESDADNEKEDVDADDDGYIS